MASDSVGRISLRDGTLFASANDGAEFELTPTATNRFAITGTAVVIEFVPPTDGKPHEIHVTGDGPKPSVSRAIAPWTPSNAELHAFEGIYTSDDVDGTYTIVARDSNLILRVPTRADIDLPPVFEDAFSSRMLGVVKFSRDARGRVAAFTATAPGVRGLRFERAASAAAAEPAPP